MSGLLHAFHDKKVRISFTNKNFGHATSTSEYVKLKHLYLNLSDIFEVVFTFLFTFYAF